MQRWDYLVLRAASLPGTELQETDNGYWKVGYFHYPGALKYLGDQGWELVGFKDPMVTVLKRPVGSS